MSESGFFDKLETLLDRTAIVDVVCKYAVSIDRRQWAELESCFVDEIDINTIRTGKWVRLPRADVIAVLRRVFESYTATQHVSANHQVTMEGQTASVVSTLNATHYLAGAEDGEFHQQVGYYEYRLVRQQGWKISSVEQFAHWQRGNQAIFDGTLQ